MVLIVTTGYMGCHGILPYHTTITGTGTHSYIKKQHQRVDCELKIGAVISNLVHQAISI